MGGEIGVQSAPGRGAHSGSPPACGSSRRQPRAPAAVPADLQACACSSWTTMRPTARSCSTRQPPGAWRPTAPRMAQARWRCCVRPPAHGAPYDLALLDMHMPGMDGLDLASAITADPALGAIRLVLLTSGGDRHRTEARQAGIHVCLTKPVRQAQLYDCLTTVWAQPPRRRRATRRRPWPLPRPGPCARRRGTAHPARRRQSDQSAGRRPHAAKTRLPGRCGRQRP